MPLRGTVHIADDADSVIAATASWIATCSATAIADHGRFTVALPGGTTPRALYARLTQAPFNDTIEWPLWHVYFGDERACAPTDEASNYNLAQQMLLSKVNISESHVFRMHGEAENLDSAARDYSEMLSTTLPHTHGVPQLDCIILGLGEDGHTASLFPGSPALDVSTPYATTSTAPYPPHPRITLTFPVLNAATNVAFMVVGAQKRNALHLVETDEAPAAQVHGTGTLTWFMDRAAAEQLTAQGHEQPTGK